MTTIMERFEGSRRHSEENKPNFLQGEMLSAFDRLGEGLDKIRNLDQTLAEERKKLLAEMQTGIEKIREETENARRQMEDR